MAVESASDLASMFDADEFAEAATYLAPDPGAEPATCTVIIDRGQGRERFRAGEASAVTSERHLMVRRAELVSVARDGTFDLVDDDGVATGESYQVVGLPKLDETGAVWSVDLAILD